MSKGYGSLFTAAQGVAVSGKESVSNESRETPYNILFVDDEPNVLASLRRVFRRENYNLLFAENAEEALALLEKQPVELVVSDYLMPGMNGSQLLARVRESWPDTLRIMLTGQAGTEAVMGSVKDGAVYRFILKPWNDDDLRLTIALALEQFELLRRNRSLQEKNNQQHRDLETLAKLSTTNRSQLAIFLHKKGLLNATQIQQLHRDMLNRKTPVVRQLLERDWISMDKVYELLRDDMLFEEIDLREFQPDAALLSLIPTVVCTRQMILPLRIMNNRLRLGMVDPMDMGLIEELGFVTGMSVETVLCRAGQMQQKLDELYGGGVAALEDMASIVGGSDPYEGIEIVLDEDERESLDQLLGSSEEPPAIRLVNAIILEALRLRASDVHIQPRTKHIVVRYRVDGVLRDNIHIPSNLLMSLVSRIKIMAELDITERRRPQDGRITVKTPMRIVDLRISTLPTINGEKIVMRVLERQSKAQTLDDLGLSDYNLKLLRYVISKPQGIVLATGPTGSGKTTTLYAMLQHDASPEKNYVTIEDPVEIQVDLAGQVPVRERIGLSFANVLRAILRQDPDVILLGEIRDAETVDVAFHAALTGHLVFSTLHTNSAVSTIARLLDLGLKPYVIASALEAIIAQRLVRRLCEHCREPSDISPERLAMLGQNFLEPGRKLFTAKGCNHCHKGYRGRVGIHEVMVMNHALRDAVTDGVSASQLLEIAKAQGMRALLDDALSKLEQGLTSPEEILRLLGPQEMSVEL